MKMSPAFARFNAAYRALTNAIFGGDLALKTVVCNNRSRLGFGEFGRSAPLAAIRGSVLNAVSLIIGARIPAQILKHVVLHVPVIVAPFGALRLGANKGLQNQSMGPLRLGLVVLPQKAEMPKVRGCCGERFEFPRLDGFNLSKIRDFVKALKANNGFPYFHGIYHTMVWG